MGVVGKLPKTLVRTPARVVRSGPRSGGRAVRASGPTGGGGAGPGAEAPAVPARPTQFGGVSLEGTPAPGAGAGHPAAMPEQAAEPARAGARAGPPARPQRTAADLAARLVHAYAALADSRPAFAHGVHSQRTVPAS